jgi:hypothetical protein
MEINLYKRLQAARLIKDIEKQRMLTFLNASTSSANEDSETVPTCLAVSRASTLCDDLDEEDQYFGDVPSQIMIPRRDTKRQRKKGLMRRLKLGEVID